MKSSLNSSLSVLSLILFCAFAAFAQAQQPEVYVQQGPDSVTCIAVSPDGRLLATGSRSVQSDVIRLYDLKQRLELRTLRQFEVQSLAFSPDGKWLAGAGKEEKQTVVNSSFGDYLKTVYSIRLWDVATGTILRTIATADSSFHDIVFTPDGQFVAASSADPTKLWDVAGKVEPRVLPGKSSALRLAISPDGQTLASETYEHTIKLWDIATRVEKRVLAGHKSSIHALRFSPDGRMLISGSYDKTLSLWDLATGRLVKTLTDKKTVEDIYFSKDGKSFLSVSSDKVRKWLIASGDARDLFREPSSGLNAARFTADGSFVISVGYQQIIVSEIESGRPVHTFAKRGSNICALWMLDDEKTHALIAEDYTKTNVWDYEAGEYRGAVNGTTFCNSGTGVLSPDRALIATTDKGGIAIINANTRSPLHKIETGQSYLTTYSFAFSPDSRLLAAGGMDGVTKILELKNRKIISSINHNAPPKKVEVTAGVTVTDPSSMFPNMPGRMAFSPDNKILAGAVSDPRTFTNLIIFWDAETGRELLRLAGHDESATALTFSPDGKRFASGDGRGVVKVWDAKTGKEIFTLTGHNGSIGAILFAPNDVLITGGGDAQLKLWDLSKGAELVSLVSINGTAWLAVTPSGLFDGSPGAWSEVLWRFSQDTYDVAPVEIFFDEYFYPNLLSDILAGQRPVATTAIKAKDRRQPLVNLKIGSQERQATGSTTLPQTNGTVSNVRNITVRVELSEAGPDVAHAAGSGANDVRLFRNGSLVKAWRGELALRDGKATVETSISLVAGENRLTAYAFNRDNIKSADAALTITGAPGLKRAAVAYVLAVGVNEYANTQYNLKYAVADARAFGAEIEAQQQKLARFERVEIVALHDQDATKANIIKRLEELAKKTQPEDIVFIYFAGHGTAQQNRFFLIPHDLGYAGNRTQLDSEGLQNILSHSISDIELERAVEGIDAGQLLLVIDACNSGQALEAEEKRRGPMNSKGLAQLAYEKGMYILTAAQSYQAALEAAKLGHGYLTYALVEEGLKSNAADSEPQDGQVVIREWLNYATRRVPQMQQEYIVGKRQLVQQGSQSPPAAQGTSSTDVQRPRVFYRREVEPQPLIVARP